MRRWHSPRFQPDRLLSSRRKRGARCGACLAQQSWRRSSATPTALATTRQALCSALLASLGVPSRAGSTSSAPRRLLLRSAAQALPKTQSLTGWTWTMRATCRARCRTTGSSSSASQPSQSMPSARLRPCSLMPKRIWHRRDRRSRRRPSSGFATASGRCSRTRSWRFPTSRSSASSRRKRGAHCSTCSARRSWRRSSPVRVSLARLLSRALPCLRAVCRRTALRNRWRRHVPSQ